LDVKYPTAEQSVDVRFRVNPLKVTDEDGKVVEGPYPAETDTIRFYLEWRDDWKIVYSVNVVRQP
jgi:hypothetical protein